MSSSPGTRLLAGCMSGTSADGIDTALVKLTGDPLAPDWEVAAHHTVSFSPEIRKETARDGDLSVRLPDGGVDLDRHLEELRRKYMMEAMERVGGVQTKAAEMLGMTFRSFRYFAKKYNMTGKESAGPHASAATGEQGM